MLFFCEEYSRDQGWVGKLIGLHNLTVFMHWNGENVYGQHRYQVSALYQASALSLSFQFYIVMNVFKLPLNLTITAE